MTGPGNPPWWVRLSDEIAGDPRREANIVVEYKAAQWASQNTTPGTAIQVAAEKIVRELSGRAVTYRIECLLCRRTYDFTITVKLASELVAAPRGICGRHGGEDQEITLIEGG